jgi:hypothetical protein
LNTNIDHLTDWQIEELILNPPAVRGKGLGTLSGRVHGKNRESSGLNSEVEPTLSEDAQMHLETCPACRFRKMSLEETLLLYRRAALLRAEEAMPAIGLRGAPAPSDSFFSFEVFGRWRAQAVVFLLMLLVLIPTLVAHEKHEQEARQAARNHVIREQTKDDLLLQQVDQEITESVPQPMQSLTQPVLTEEK